MKTARLFGLLITLSLVLATPAQAQRETLSGADASLLGLEEAWQRTVSAGAGHGQLADIVLHVSSENSYKLIEIHDGDKMVWRRSTKQLNPRTGLEMGEEATKKLAEREMIGLKSLGIKGEIKEQTIARIYLYALGADGTIQAINAETGETLWINRYGKPSQPKFSLGVSDEYVAFVSGTTLFQLDATTGQLIKQDWLDTIPIEGPVITGDYMMVSTSGGGIEGRYTRDLDEAPYLTQTTGQAAAKARAFPDSSRVAWPTTRGYVYCMEFGGTPSEMFRLDSPGAVTGRIETVGKDLLFFCSESGHVYGIQATISGDLKWTVSTGEPMHGDMIAFGEQVYGTSGRGNLYAFKVQSGGYAWDAPASRIQEVIGATKERLYARDSGNRLVALSTTSGARAGTASGTRIHKTIINRKTDRIYLLTKQGTVQCLRPIGKDLPELKTPVEFREKPKSMDAEVAKEEKADGNPFEEKGDVDPFGGGNPFDAPAGDGADPFGGDANDPFGGGGDSDAGAADDPFGTSPF